MNDLSVAGEYLLNTGLSNKDLLKVSLNKETFNKKTSMYSISNQFALITSLNEDLLLVGKTQPDDMYVPLEFQIYNLTNDKFEQSFERKGILENHIH